MFDALQTDVRLWRAQLWARAVQQTCHQDLSVTDALSLQDLFDKTRLDCFRFEDGVEQLAIFLRNKGLAAVIITNGNAQIQREKLQACECSRLFPHVLIGGGALSCCSSVPLVQLNHVNAH